MKVRGCLAYRKYSSDISPREIYLLPLPEGNPIALSEWVPIENNALRIKIGGTLQGAPGRVGDLLFAPTGDQLLLLADRQTEWEDLVGPTTDADELFYRGLELYLADLRRRFISRLTLGAPFKRQGAIYSQGVVIVRHATADQDYSTISWTAQGQIVATRGGKLLLIDPQAWHRNPNHIAQLNKDFWILTDNAQWHTLTPDLREAYFLNRKGTRLGFVSCERDAKVRWLPPIAQEHGKVETAFPTDMGLMVVTVVPKEVGGYGPQTLWAWSRGQTSYRQVGHLPSDVEVGAYLHKRNAFLVGERLTRYDERVQSFVPRYENRSWFRLGLCSARSGKVQWFRIDHPEESVPATEINLLQIPNQGSLLVVQGSNFHPDEEKRQDWAWIGVLDVSTMRVEWVRRFQYNEVWAWSPRCDGLLLDKRR